MRKTVKGYCRRFLTFKEASTERVIRQPHILSPGHTEVSLLSVELTCMSKVDDGSRSGFRIVLIFTLQLISCELFSD